MHSAIMRKILPDTSLYTDNVDRLCALAAVRKEQKEGGVLQTKDHDGEWVDTFAQPYHDTIYHREWRIRPQDSIHTTLIAA